MSTVEVAQMPTAGIDQVHELKKVDVSGVTGSPSSSNNNNNNSSSSGNAQRNVHQHPLHQFDLTVMSKFYEACVAKLGEHQPAFRAADWCQMSSPDSTTSSQQTSLSATRPLVLSHKQQVVEAFERLARETGEPMILMPNFDYGDIYNFVRFLQNLKSDGLNSVNKFKNYLNNMDMRKFEVDLVVLHARYGLMLFEIKDGDHLDNKRRMRAKAQLSNARICFDSISRLLVEARGWTHAEASIPITEFIALPNMLERPVHPAHHQHHLQQQQQQATSQGTPSTPSTSGVPLQTPSGNHNVSATSSTSVSATGTSVRHSPRMLHYLTKPDLDNEREFAAWWNRCVVEPKQLQRQAQEADNKLNKCDQTLVNWMIGLLDCIRSNSMLPVVYPEQGVVGELTAELLTNESQPQQPQPPVHQPAQQQPQPQPQPSTTTSGVDEPKPTAQCGESSGLLDKPHQFQPALNVFAEFMHREHEQARSCARVVVTSRDADSVRRTVCLQILWLLLNDSQKKISVVCAEENKPYYDAFFARQRKLYANMNNLRFYVDLQSCTVNQTHTVKTASEVWLFESGVKCAGAGGVKVAASEHDIVERAKNLNAFWIFSTEEAAADRYRDEFNKLRPTDAPSSSATATPSCTSESLSSLPTPLLHSLPVRYVRIDECGVTARATSHQHQPHPTTSSQQVESVAGALHSASLKLPMRLHCDLLVIGDIISTNQVNSLYRYLKTNHIQPHATYHHNGNNSNQYNNNSNNNHQQHMLNFNPAKKFRTVKFVRGGTIDNLRSSLKMHDSIQAQCVLIHVGDEDLFKTRNSQTTVERIKELCTLVREYCPKSFVILSTLMRRMSRTENSVTNEVNKGLVAFCKHTRDSGNFYHMLNSHFEPDVHTQEGRVLNTKGLRLYTENVLFMVDHFLIKNNKQH